MRTNQTTYPRNSRNPQIYQGWNSRVFQRQRFRGRGFSMIETTIAIGVFAIGFVAVASIFPVATLLQKQVANDVLVQQVERNVTALLQARPFTVQELNNNINFDPMNPANPNYDPNNPPTPADITRVQPVLRRKSINQLLAPPAYLSTAVPPPDPGDPNRWEKWKLNDRSYFFVREDRGKPAPGRDGHLDRHIDELANPYATEFNRAYYWVPMARRRQYADPDGIGGASPLTAVQDWHVYVFILRKDDDTYNRDDISSKTSQWPGWANYDGLVGATFNVPGIYGMRVTATSLTRFAFNNDRDNDGEPDEMQVGDMFLDHNGVVHVVNEADHNGIEIEDNIPGLSTSMLGTPAAKYRLWYGRPASTGRDSPLKQILLLTNVVR